MSITTPTPPPSTADIVAGELAARKARIVIPCAPQKPSANPAITAVYTVRPTQFVQLAQPLWEQDLTASQAKEQEARWTTLLSAELTLPTSIQVWRLGVMATFDTNQTTIEAIEREIHMALRRIEASRVPQLRSGHRFITLAKQVLVFALGG
jgi:hypothetical protein